jgi:transcription-repair coupling factor (superfamily II helicase)
MHVVEPLHLIRSDPRLQALAQRLIPARGLAIADGLWGSAGPIVAGLIAEQLGRPLLLVTAHSDEADDCRDDLETAIGRAPELLPQLETLPGEAIGDDELEAERLRLCLMLSELGAAGPDGAGSMSVTTGSVRPPRRTSEQPAAAAIHASPGGDQLPWIIVAPIQALMQPVPSPAAIADWSRSISVGEALHPDSLTEWLTAHRFQRCDQVEVPGDYARRGGILDVFGHGQAHPVRIEFFGDQVESIRVFDAGTQRSSQSVASVRILATCRPGTGVVQSSALPPPPPAMQGSALRAADAGDATTGFLACLPADALIAFLEPAEIQEIGRTYWQRLGERAGVLPVDAIFRRANDFRQLHLRRFAAGEDGAIALGVGGLPHFEPRADRAREVLAELSKQSEVILFCDNLAEQQRFRELLDEWSGEGEQGGDGRSEADAVLHSERIRTAVGVIHHGFIWRPLAREDRRPVAFIPHHELFSRYRQRRTLRKVAPARPIDSFFDLNVGDYVVHAAHGIGKFVALKGLEKSGRRDEYLAIEFANRATVHVPVSQIHVVQKYIGSVRGRPALSKLGGSAWKRTRLRVAESVTDLAAELLAIQARRQTEPGVAYPQDTSWQREFEESFLYTETEDQLRALAELKADMCRPRPMDRLLCGDVGFGKTELAVRAAFKAMEYGRQVAVLVPTTVLAEQHYQTFRERLADYPFVIECLSRFRTKAEQGRIVERSRKGQIDALIGTHRLLSGDVRFADLGLVIIDEEQRFGVEAKERLKCLRATVDVLTLSATPIPRTLHMSLLGIRDISSLATPPADRRAIVTQVRMWEDAMIREAVLRELNREGQVYFVHNFVRDIRTVANHLRSIVPEARIVVGHGQMSARELEEVMLAFVRREADVLVSTNIIESGLDIPTANTIFINRAERFGLADLHQLRGRVGRSRHRAYCYLLLSPRHPVKETAARRLKAIEHYSDLGAGFQIAMRDLEIRGAGNILGPEQSGNIEAVGYEMYCQLLEEAVRRLRNEPVQAWRPVNLELGLSASIPRAYIRSERQRMEVYKRLASCRSAGDVAALHDDLRDAFGEPPADVHTLLELAEIRVLAQPWGIRSIVLDPPDVIFAIEDLARAEPLFASGPGSPRVPDARTVHWRLPKRYLEPPTLLAVLRKQLSAPPRREREFASATSDAALVANADCSMKNAE